MQNYGFAPRSLGLGDQLIHGCQHFEIYPPISHQITHFMLATYSSSALVAQQFSISLAMLLWWSPSSYTFDSSTLVPWASHPISDLLPVTLHSSRDAWRCPCILWNLPWRYHSTQKQSVYHGFLVPHEERQPELKQSQQELKGQEMERWRK